MPEPEVAPNLDFSKLEKKYDDLFAALQKRFDDLKKETETVLNKFAEDGQSLQKAVQDLAKAQEDSIKKLNMAIDEIRSVGGRNLPHANPEPVQTVKSNISVGFFDMDED